MRKFEGHAPIPVADGGALMPVARFETRGRVLNIERFKPHQSRVNWGPGAAARHARHRSRLRADVGHRNRRTFQLFARGCEQRIAALFARPRGAMTQQQFDALSPNITNVHVIPSSDGICAELRRVKTGERVTLRGLLVNVRSADGRVAYNIDNSRRPRLRNTVARRDPH